MNTLKDRISKLANRAKRAVGLQSSNHWYTSGNNAEEGISNQRTRLNQLYTIQDNYRPTTSSNISYVEQNLEEGRRLYMKDKNYVKSAIKYITKLPWLKKTEEETATTMTAGTAASDSSATTTNSDGPRLELIDSDSKKGRPCSKKNKKVHFCIQDVPKDKFAVVVQKVSSYHLDEDVIEACLRRMQKMCPEFLFTSPYTTMGIMMLNNGGVSDILDPLKAKKYKVVFFVVKSKSQGNEPDHASLLAYYKDLKAIFHFDSMLGRNRQLAVKITHKCRHYFNVKNFIDVPCQQQNKYVDSNACVVENITKLVFIYDSRSNFKELTPIHIRKLNSGNPNIIRAFIIDQYIIEKSMEFGDISNVM